MLLKNKEAERKDFSIQVRVLIQVIMKKAGGLHLLPTPLWTSPVLKEEKKPQHPTAPCNQNRTQESATSSKDCHSRTSMGELSLATLVENLSVVSFTNFYSERITSLSLLSMEFSSSRLWVLNYSRVKNMLQRLSCSPCTCVCVTLCHCPLHQA